MMKKYLLILLAAMAFVACEDDDMTFDYMTPAQIDAESLEQDLCTGVLSIKDLNWDNVLVYSNGKWCPLNKNQDGIGIPTYLFYPDGTLWYCCGSPSRHYAGLWKYDPATATLYTTEQEDSKVFLSMRVAFYDAQSGNVDLEGEIVYYSPFGAESLRMRCELRKEHREQTIQRFAKPHND